MTTTRVCQLEGCGADISHRRADAKFCCRAHYDKAINSTPERKAAQARPARRQRAEQRKAKEEKAKSFMKRQFAPGITNGSFFRQMRRLKVRMQEQYQAELAERAAAEAEFAESTFIATTVGPRCPNPLEEQLLRKEKPWSEMTPEEIEELYQESKDFIRQSEDPFGESYENEWGYR
jgi:hypothetical protein